jgi:hypothetical protein
MTTRFPSKYTHIQIVFRVIGAEPVRNTDVKISINGGMRVNASVSGWHRAGADMDQGAPA